MEKTTLGDIVDMIHELKNEKGYTEEEIRDMVIYLGDDEELNGVHACYYAGKLDEDDEDDQWTLQDINDKESKKKGIILLS